MPHRQRIAAFAERGGLRRAAGLSDLFDDQFPMVLPPDQEDGLGVAILNSNAETHFSFTNALGLVSITQAHRLGRRCSPIFRRRDGSSHCIITWSNIRCPSRRSPSGSETALINGSWFVRKLKPFSARTVVTHGHRHIDWIGACGAMKIISAPSPVMGATDDAPTHFLIHTLAAGSNGRLCLLRPERVEIAGETAG